MFGMLLKSQDTFKYTDANGKSQSVGGNKDVAHINDANRLNQLRKDIYDSAAKASQAQKKIDASEEKLESEHAANLKNIEKQLVDAKHKYEQAQGNMLLEASNVATNTLGYDISDLKLSKREMALLGLDPKKGFTFIEAREALERVNASYTDGTRFDEYDDLKVKLDNTEKWYAKRNEALNEKMVPYQKNLDEAQASYNTAIETENERYGKAQSDNFNKMKDVHHDLDVANADLRNQIEAFAKVFNNATDTTIDPSSVYSADAGVDVSEITKQNVTAYMKGCGLIPESSSEKDVVQASSQSQQQTSSESQQQIGTTVKQNSTAEIEAAKGTARAKVLSQNAADRQSQQEATQVASQSQQQTESNGATGNTTADTEKAKGEAKLKESLRKDAASAEHDAAVSSLMNRIVVGEFGNGADRLENFKEFLGSEENKDGLYTEDMLAEAQSRINADYAETGTFGDYKSDAEIAQAKAEQAYAELGDAARSSDYQQSDEMQAGE